MLAVVKVAPGVGNVEVRDMEEPATEPGQVKIGVRAAGICGTDLHIYHDEFKSWPPVVLVLHVDVRGMEGQTHLLHPIFGVHASVQPLIEGVVHLCSARSIQRRATV